MPGQLLNVWFDELSEQNRRCETLANFWGIDSAIIHASAIAAADLTDSLLVVDAGELGKALDAGSFDSSLRDRILGPRSQLFVHSLEPDSAARTALRWITGDRGAEIHKVDPTSEYKAVPETASIQAELAGASWGPANNAVDFGLSFLDSSFRPILKLGNHEFLASGIVGNCTVFLLASKSFLDLDSPAVEGKTLKGVCSKFVPMRMVLRSIFGEQCWHVDRHRANLVIDDPYLRSHYGGLSLPGLIEQTRLHDFAATIAFIPWNYRRTDPKTARMLQESEDRVSLCVHGCNHTGHEFGTSDRQRLHGLIQEGLGKMEQHAKQSGLAHHFVMVFPQGVFSRAAMLAVKHHGFHAITNSSPFAANAASESITFRDLLSMAVTAYDDMPLFVRRYPTEDLFEMKLDAFLGKPLLFVEHHAYFDDGFQRLTDFVSKLNEFPFPIEWTSLGSLCQHGYQLRKLSDARYECRVYSNSIVLDNPQEHEIRIRVMKSERNPSAMDGVFANGRPLEFEASRQQIAFDLDLAACEQNTISFRYREPARTEMRYSLRETCRITMRRRMSDFRDNVVSKSPTLLAAAEKAKDALRRS